MTSFPYAGRAVVVLGDCDTGQHVEMLAGKAAAQSASIAEFHTFDSGEPSSQDDLGKVDAVVSALSRALAIRADIWVPFPREDLRREEHVRRLSLVLQRHGLNLVLGPNLWPCPLAGGIHEMDVALRREVRAVDDLDHAAVAAAGVRTLSDEIEQALQSGQGRAALPSTALASNRAMYWSSSRPTSVRTRHCRPRRRVGRKDVPPSNSLPAGSSTNAD